MDSEDKRDVTYLINELSQKRIREYEKGGLIKPAREPRTNNRRYSEADIHQILRVKELIHEHGFTVACLRYFLASAPCWVIFSCAEKEGCASYNNPRMPCYAIAQKATDHPGLKNCKRCPIYLNRDIKKMPLLLKS